MSAAGRRRETARPGARGDDRRGRGGRPGGGRGVHRIDRRAPVPNTRPRGVGAALRVRTLERSCPTILPLDRVARAIVDTYVALREIGERSGASLTLTPRAGGIVRCSMPAGNAAENARLASALDEAINPASNPRYVVSRPTWPVGPRPRTVVWRALTFKAPLDESWDPVPSDLGSHKDRATAYHTAWQDARRPGPASVRRPRSSRGPSESSAVAWGTGVCVTGGVTKKPIPSGTSIYQR